MRELGAGVLPLTFQNTADYDRIAPDDVIAIRGLKTFSPGKPLSLEVTKKDGQKFTIPVSHTFNENQIEWFQAGSALNAMKNKAQ